MKKVYFPVLLAVLGFLIYSGSLSGEFVGDDHYWFVNHHEIKNIWNPLALFAEYRGRFIFGISIAINYLIGGFNTVGYHIFNVGVHVLASYLVYQFILITSRTPYFKSNKTFKNEQSFAMAAALIFLCHPIQVEAVAFVTQRMTSMAACFYLATLILFIKYQLENDQRAYIAAAVVMTLGLFTKEITVTAVITIAFYSFFFFEEKIKDLALDKKILTLFGITILVPMVYFLNQARDAGNWSGHVGLHLFDWNYLWTEINVFRTYLRMLVWPVNLNHDYDYQMVNGFFNLPTIFSFCLLVGLAALAVKLYKKERLLSFCIAWFFITTSVEAAAVVFGNRNIIYDHWLYLPMVGYAVFFTSICYRIAKDKAGRQGLLVTALIVLSFMSFQRSRIWRSEVSLWEDVIAKSPNKPGPYLALAEAYQRRGLYEKAKSFYHKALERDPKYDKVYANLAILEFMDGETDKAVATLKKALLIDPFNDKAYNNLGYIYFLKGDCDKSLEFYHKSIKLQGNYADADLYQGQCYLKQGKEDQAKEVLLRAVKEFKERREFDKEREAMAIIKKHF